METLSKYEGWQLFDMKSCRPQANMEIATVKAKRFDVLEGRWDERVILFTSNNNSQFEIMIQKEAFDYVAGIGGGLSEKELQLLDGMILVQKNHAERCDKMSNQRMAEKQKASDMERVALLEKVKGLPLNAAKRIETLEDHIKKTCANALELGMCSKHDCKNCDTTRVLKGY